MNAGSPHDLFDCFVLHRRDYSNTSLLVDLFSRKLGRFPVIAKGAKRPRNPGGALLQPFQPLLIAVAGRGEVKTLRQVEAAAPPPAIGGAGLYCGFYLNELITRLVTRSDPHERLYDHYAAALAELASQADQAAVLRRFELRLLEETGYAMVLDREVEHGAALRPEARYVYDPERGPLLCDGAAPGSSVSGSTLLALASGATLSPLEAAEAKALMRRVLAHHLGPKPLKSREMYKQLLIGKS